MTISQQFAFWLASGCVTIMGIMAGMLWRALQHRLDEMDKSMATRNSQVDRRLEVLGTDDRDLHKSVEKVALAIQENSKDMLRALAESNRLWAGVLSQRRISEKWEKQSDEPKN